MTLLGAGEGVDASAGKLHSSSSKRLAFSRSCVDITEEKVLADLDCVEKKGIDLEHDGTEDVNKGKGKDGQNSEGAKMGKGVDSAQVAEKARYFMQLGGATGLKATALKHHPDHSSGIKIRFSLISFENTQFLPFCM